ncbi:MAG: hypothetical protein EBT49_09580 [Betaproteobacteria bacterium]|nr:hypothetical protein [Betaproteobacteria bacterium]
MRKQIYFRYQHQMSLMSLTARLLQNQFQLKLLMGLSSHKTSLRWLLFLRKKFLTYSCEYHLHRFIHSIAQFFSINTADMVPSAAAFEKQAFKHLTDEGLTQIL